MSSANATSAVPARVTCHARTCRSADIPANMVQCVMCSKHYCASCAVDACEQVTAGEAGDVLARRVAHQRAVHERVLQEHFTEAERAVLPFELRVEHALRDGPACLTCLDPTYEYVDGGQLTKFLCARLQWSWSKAVQQFTDARAAQRLRERLPQVVNTASALPANALPAAASHDAQDMVTFTPRKHPLCHSATITRMINHAGEHYVKSATTLSDFRASVTRLLLVLANGVPASSGSVDILYATWNKAFAASQFCASRTKPRLLQRRPADIPCTDVHSEDA